MSPQGVHRDSHPSDSSEMLTLYYRGFVLPRDYELTTEYNHNGGLDAAFRRRSDVLGKETPIRTEMVLLLALFRCFRQAPPYVHSLVESPMAPYPLDSLSPSERNVLRVLLRERDQKAIARQLNVSPETVKTHLRNAREKTGVRTSFALARALAEHEAHPPEGGIPRFEGEPSPPPSITKGSSKRPEGLDQDGDAFHERRAIFDYGPSSFMVPAPWEEKKRNPLPASMRMLIVTGMGILLVALIILAFPLSESFQRFADVLDPPKH